MSGWNFGETAEGIPMAWYTPERYARMKAQSEEYHESGEAARDEMFLTAYAANPHKVLAQAIVNTFEPFGMRLADPT